MKSRQIINYITRPLTRLFYGVGAIAIITGGLLSAISAPHPSYLSSWAVAYIVLVWGVVQIVIGAGIARLSRKDISNKIVIAILILANLGNSAVVGGTLLKHDLAHNQYVVYAGGLLLAVAIGVAMWIVRGKVTARLIAYYCFLAIVLVSIVIGVMLAS